MSPQMSDSFWSNSPWCQWCRRIRWRLCFLSVHYRNLGHRGNRVPTVSLIHQSRSWQIHFSCRRGTRSHWLSIELGWRAWVSWSDCWCHGRLGGNVSRFSKWHHSTSTLIPWQLNCRKVLRMQRRVWSPPWSSLIALTSGKYVRKIWPSRWISWWWMSR